MKRIVATTLAVVLGANGVVMLVAGSWWYGLVPGVTATGPFNPHFVMDIGAAYLVVAGALAWWLFRPGPAHGAVVAAAAFLGLHALIHIADALMGGHAAADLVRDSISIFLPALAGAWIAWPSQRQA